MSQPLDCRLVEAVAAGGVEDEQGLLGDFSLGQDAARFWLEKSRTAHACNSDLVDVLACSILWDRVDPDGLSGWRIDGCEAEKCILPRVAVKTFFAFGLAGLGIFRSFFSVDEFVLVVCRVGSP